MSREPADSYSPFESVSAKDELGEVIVKDDVRRFALIASIEPEAAIHWLAIPYESGQTTAELQTNNRERFLDLLDWTVLQTQLRIDEYPDIAHGFTIKLHFGTYETVPHAKLHVLSVE